MTLEYLKDADLGDVNGGFKEQNKILPTVGMNIVCPKCKTSDPSAFAGAALFDPNLDSVEYHCKCGCKFVCYKNQVILRKDFDDLCKANGIKYGF